MSLQLTCYASEARTATPTAMADRTNEKRDRGVRVVINVTAVSATPSVTFTIQGKCLASGTYYTLLASAAITGTGQTVLVVYPGLTASANAVANNVLPSVWRVIATHGDSDSITYSVSADPLP